jgi:DNA-binding MurR/RpiR family transcriptional regulator
MPYRAKIREAHPDLSKSFTRLADYLLDFYTQAAFMTATELARTLELDAATVVRFSQHLGYRGYPQLLREIQAHVKEDLLLQPRSAHDSESTQGWVSSAFDDLKIALEQTSLNLDAEAFSRLADHIGQARRTVVVAEGPAQPAAYNLVYYLEQGSFPVQMARSGLAGLARAIHSASQRDLLIAIDIANEAPYIAPALREARGKGITTAAIVGSPSLASARSAAFSLAARANPDLGIAIINIEALVYALVQTLRQQYMDRFEGSEQAISDLTSLLQ